MKSRLILLLLLLPLIALSQSTGGAAYRRRASTLTVKSQSNTGLFVWLSDGSAWEIRHSDRDRSQHWQPGKKVVVYITSDSEYPYRLYFDPGANPPNIVSARYLKRL